jgi:hypothetical protein
MKSIIAMIDEAGIPYATFNTDAPESGRLCISAPTTARAAGWSPILRHGTKVKRGGRVLVIDCDEETDRFSKSPNITVNGSEDSWR